MKILFSASAVKHGVIAAALRESPKTGAHSKSWDVGPSSLHAHAFIRNLRQDNAVIVGCILLVLILLTLWGGVGLALGVLVATLALIGVGKLWLTIADAVRGFIGRGSDADCAAAHAGYTDVLYLESPEHGGFRGYVLARPGDVHAMCDGSIDRLKVWSDGIQAFVCCDRTWKIEPPLRDGARVIFACGVVKRCAMRVEKIWEF